ncbi:MAG TPA: cytochrome c [Xanthobacteraceae bacterium]
MRPWWPSALALVAVAAQPAIAGGPTPDPAGLANLVRQDCGSCHGLTLKGGLGKPLTADRLRHWDRAQLIHIILDGVPGTPMPAWRPLLTEAEAAWIANALKTGTLP